METQRSVVARAYLSLLLVIGHCWVASIVLRRRTRACLCRAGFVTDAVTTLQEEHPDIVSRMAEHCSAVGYRIVDGGTKVLSRGKLRWDASIRGTGLTTACKSSYMAYDSANAFGIAAADLVLSNSAPFVRELPEAVLEYSRDEPGSLLAQRFRLYIEHSFLPSMRRVAELLFAHAAVVDVPPTEWLRERFPDEPWHSIPPSMYRYIWVGWRRVWEVVVASWREGDLSLVRPRGSSLYPYGKSII